MSKSKTEAEKPGKASRKKKEDEKYERPLTDPFPDDQDDNPLGAPALPDPPAPDTNNTPQEKELSVEVLKAKITNEIFLYSEYKVNTKDDKGTFKKDGENPIHDDLKHAFAALTPHLASLAEQFNTKGKLDKAQITCRGFGIGSNGEGVVLHGTRLLSNGKAFNFNTPFYRWDTEKSESLFGDDAEDLRSAINTCRAEVIKYLFKHKYQPETK